MFDYGWVCIIGVGYCVVCGGGGCCFGVGVGIIVFDDCCGICWCLFGVIGGCDCYWFVC